MNWDNVSKKTIYEPIKEYRNTMYPSCTKKFADTGYNRRWGLVGKTHQTNNDWGSYEDNWCEGCNGGTLHATWDDLWTGENPEHCASCALCRGEVKV